MKTWISKLKYAAFLVAVSAIIAGDVLAENCALPGPQCAAPYYYPPNCYQPCKKADTANPHGGGEAPPRQFVAPPPSGEVQGESNSMGINGFSLRIPESTLRMPTLQLPSLVRYRRDAEMLTDQAKATLQATRGMSLVPGKTAAPHGGGEAPPKVDPHGGGEAPPTNCMPCIPRGPCGAQNSGVPRDDQVAQLQQQVSQLTVLVEQLAAMQQGQAAPRTAPVQPAGYQTAPVQPSQRDLQQLQAQDQVQQQAQAQFEQKCRELDEMQAQLASVQWEYQALLEAKQTQITQQREARLQKQFTGGNSVASEPQVTPSTAPVGNMSAKRSANATPELPKHPAFVVNTKVKSEREVASQAQAPVQSRRQATTISASMPQEPVTRSSAERLPSNQTDTFSDIASEPESLESVVEADEKLLTATEEKQQTGSRLGRWFKRGK